MDIPVPTISRRRFLRGLGLAGAAALPTLAGIRLLREVEGELPPVVPAHDPPTRAATLRVAARSGAPLLLLVNERAENPNGYYLGEILRAEGLSCFETARVASLATGPLAPFDVVLLAEGPLHTREAETLMAYVANGGGLVAMRPAPQLLPVLGLERVPGQTADGAMCLGDDYHPGEATAEQVVRFRGVADHYRSAGAEAAAWLDGAGMRSGMRPAITLHRYGRGWVCCWAYDLARSIAYTRQGNPAWANRERDGLEGVRASDMFAGWVDPVTLRVPHADVQQRLLARLLLRMTSDTRPLPRVWYFPGAADAVFIATGDSHQNPPGAIEDVLSRVERWEGRMSIYYAPPLSTKQGRVASKLRGWITAGRSLASSSRPSPEQVAQWRERGHEFGLHPYVDDGLHEGWSRYWEEFTSLGYGQPGATVRTHRALWEGWVQTARLQASLGLGMNLDYYHVGPLFQDEGGDPFLGHLTGSALPLRFVDDQGHILRIFQQPTQLVDEHLLAMPWTVGLRRLDVQSAVDVCAAFLQVSVRASPSAIAAQYHVDPYAIGDPYAASAAGFMEGTLEHAATLGMPIWSAQQWLQFTEARHATRIEQVVWEPTSLRLHFAVHAPAQLEADIALLVPASLTAREMSEVRVDGRRVRHGYRTMDGDGSAWFAVGAGTHQIEVHYHEP